MVNGTFGPPFGFSTPVDPVWNGPSSRTHSVSVIPLRPSGHVSPDREEPFSDAGGGGGLRTREMYS